MHADPPGLKGGFTRKELERGRHVYVEKNNIGYMIIVR